MTGVASSLETTGFSSPCGWKKVSRLSSYRIPAAYPVPGKSLKIARCRALRSSPSKEAG